MIKLSDILLSGALGLVNFWILRELDLLTFFNPKDKEEKNQFIIILGIMNLFIYQMLLNWDSFNFLDANYLFYLSAFIVAILLEILLGYIIKKSMENSNLKKESSGKTQKFYIETFDRILEEYEGEDLYAYIFDFQNQLIDHGYLIDYTTNRPEFNLSLSKREGHSELVINYKEFIEIVDENDDELLNFIDFKYKIKIYLFVS